MGKERPILFSSAMVKAILRGTKTQTRRVAKPQPDHAMEWASKGFDPPCALHTDAWGNPIGTHTCPYGVPGDSLWVRETWAIRDCGKRVSLTTEAWPSGLPIDRLQYVATDQAPHESGYWWNKRPSISMPVSCFGPWLETIVSILDNVKEDGRVPPDAE